MNELKHDLDGDYAEIDGVEYRVGDEINWSNVHWSSDWNGYEVGYDDIDVVGLYSFPGTEIYFYVNAETAEILEIWEAEDD